MENKYLALVPVKWATEWELRNLSGIIYRIVNLTNGKCYIGKSRKRFISRYSKLNWAEKTHSIKLKRAVGKYGRESFKVQILDSNIISKEWLTLVENYYIQLFNSIKNGYNVYSFDNNLGERTRLEFKLKNYTTGEIINVCGLGEFCEQNSCGAKCMYRLLSGEMIYYKKFCLPETDIEKVYFAINRGNARNVRTVILKNPNDELVEINNMVKFCKENSLSLSQFKGVIYGFIQEYKGWILPKTDRKNVIKYEYNSSNFIIYDKDTKNEILITNLRRFCRDNHLNRQYMQKLLKGEKNEYRNYIVKI